MKDKKKATIVILCLLIAIMGCIALYLFLHQQQEHIVLGNTNGDNEEIIKERMKKKVDKSILAVSMNQQIIFEEGSKEGLLNIENLPENNYTVYVEIKDSKSKECIYISDYIKPGYFLKKDTLLKPLKKGDYIGLATFVAIDEHEIEVKSVTTQVSIKVKK